MLSRYIHDRPRRPQSRLRKAKPAQGIIFMGIKAGGNQDEIRFERGQAGRISSFKAAAKYISPAAGGKGNIDNIAVGTGSRREPVPRIKRELVGRGIKSVRHRPKRISW